MGGNSSTLFGRFVDEYAGYGMDIYFLLGHNLYSEDGVEYYDTVADWIVHPEYSGSSGYISSDIGLMELSTGISEVEPIPLSQEAPSDLWIGEYLDYVGWGVTRDRGRTLARSVRPLFLTMQWMIHLYMHMILIPTFVLETLVVRLFVGQKRGIP